MASLGGTSFVSIRDGRPLPAGQFVERITRPGVNGVAYRLEGAGPEPFTVTAYRDVDSAAAHKTLAATLAGWRGTLKNLVDDVGNGYNNVMVLRVTDRGCRRIVAGTGGVSSLKGYYSAFEIELELTE